MAVLGGLRFCLRTPTLTMSSLRDEMAVSGGLRLCVRTPTLANSSYKNFKYLRPLSLPLYPSLSPALSLPNPDALTACQVKSVVLPRSGAAVCAASVPPCTTPLRGSWVRVNP